MHKDQTGSQRFVWAVGNAMSMAAHIPSLTSQFNAFTANNPYTHDGQIFFFVSPPHAYKNKNSAGQATQMFIIIISERVGVCIRIKESERQIAANVFFLTILVFVCHRRSPCCSGTRLRHHILRIRFCTHC